MEKVQHFSNNPMFLILLVKYLKESEMKRVHQRKTMRKTSVTYYRALENIINNSSHKSILLSHQGLELLNQLLPSEWYEILNEETSDNNNESVNKD